MSSKDLLCKNLTERKIPTLPMFSIYHQLDGKKFDLIYTNFAMHHIPNVDYMILVLAAYLKPGMCYI